MASKKVKMGLTYTITILLTLGIAGGICWYLFTTMLNGEKKDPTAGIMIEQMVSSKEYEPSSADNRTLLIIIDTERRESGVCFLVTRFLVPEKQVVFMPVPANTAAALNGPADTIYNHYRNDGAAEAEKAIESCTGVKFDKYIKFNRDSLSTAVSIFGGMYYDIPYNLIYENEATGEETIIKQGRNYLDAEQIRRVITYPNFNSGEEYRAKCLGVIASGLLCENIDSDFYHHVDDYYSAIINSDIETDITSYDYNEVSDAIKYVASNSNKVAMSVMTSGNLNEENMYVLDANFVKSITEWLKLYPSD